MYYIDFILSSYFFYLFGYFMADVSTTEFK